MLTGPNDVGKSALLRLISLLGAPERTSVTDDDVNLDFLHSHPKDWRDSEVGCLATFDITAHGRKHHLGGTVNDSDVRFDADYRLAAQSGMPPITMIYCRDGTKRSGGSTRVRQVPTIVDLTRRLTVRDEIPLAAPTNTEKVLFEMAFGTTTPADKLKHMNAINRIATLSKASDKLTRALQSLFPKENYQLRFLDVGDEKIALLLSDRHGGTAPVSRRGLGLQRLLTLIVELLVVQRNQQQHIIVLADEPEASLHADAQHHLRAMLETVAALDNIQVIYATHSPAMINASRPASVRLVERRTAEISEDDLEIAESTIDNAPFVAGYEPVRRALGTTPADSLLYAPVTVVVEGASDVIALAALLRRGGDSGIEALATVSNRVDEIAFLDGDGDSFTYLLKVLKTQGTRPVVFLDADRRSRVDSAKFREQHYDVPCILLPPGKEIEDLFHPDVYFAALAQLIEGDTAPKFEDYLSWADTSGLPSRMPFSKRVDYWLVSAHERSLDKPETVRRASELAPADQVNWSMLEELANALIGRLT